jgi:hypothetical protein
MGTISMSLSRFIVTAMLTSFAGCAAIPAVSAEVCPSRPEHSLRFVDVFDGAPDELATLVPDEAKPRSGYWKLGYVYDAGRFVTLRCKYADGKALDVKLARKVARCYYRINAQKKLALRCK